MNDVKDREHGRHVAVADRMRAGRDETVQDEPDRTSGLADTYGLFRRAICDGDDVAWEALMARYRGLVLAWIRRRWGAAAAREDDDYWVTRAFERFWMAVRPERFDQFRGLPALVQYLKLCAWSVLLDDVRDRGTVQLEPLEALEERPADGGLESSDVEAFTVGRMAGRDLWEVIWQALPDKAERQVVYLSFARDLKPREIAARYPGRFATVTEVYRAKRCALERLRRSTGIQRFLRWDGEAEAMAEERGAAMTIRELVAA
ncbi:MAG: RNA polymerase sigma factor [Chloroflexota bacterium]